MWSRYGRPAGGSGSDVITHVVAWLPLDGDSDVTKMVSVSMGAIIPALDATSAWRLGDTPAAAPLPSVSSGTWRMRLGAGPIVVPAQTSANPSLRVATVAQGAGAGSTVQLEAHTTATLAWNASGVSWAAVVSATLERADAGGEGAILAHVPLSPLQSVLDADVDQGIARAEAVVLARDRRAAWVVPDIATLLPGSQLGTAVVLRLAVTDAAVTGSARISLATSLSEPFQLLPAFEWATGAWGVCSAECGAGTRQRTVTCVRPASGTCLLSTRVQGPFF